MICLNSIPQGLVRSAIHRSAAFARPALPLAQPSTRQSCARLCTHQAQRPSVAVKGTKGFGALENRPQQATSQMTDGNASANCERLAAVRQAMAAADQGKGVDAFIVPTDDPHMSEYPPDCYKRREWISRFTGTAGTAVILKDKALLWTDGRYFLQASQELGKEWTLMRAGTPGCPDMEDWLAANLPSSGRVGIDPFVLTVDGVRRLNKKMQEAGKQVVALQEDNLVDKVWGDSRPAAPSAKLRVHPMKWAGETVSSKVQRMRGHVQTIKADKLLVTMLDEVAWLFNLRGSDVQCNPVFLSYATVGADGSATLYVDTSKITDEVQAHLKESSVAVKDYKDFATDVAATAAEGKAVWLDPSKVSFAVFNAAKQAITAKGSSTQRSSKRTKTSSGKAAPAGAGGAATPADSAATPQIIEFASPVNNAKAIKNDTELEGMREAHLRDAVALCELLYTLEKGVESGKTFTEVEVDELLTSRRAAQPGFVEPAFATIAGAGPNGAIIHYRAQPGTCRTVDSNTLLLIDSGAQFDCGTTDITRTMHYGTPTDYQKRCYTRVLQGHIGLDQAIFPEGTVGAALDTLARVPLWKEGLNYRHGTGHGVGAHLNVHEGPQSISTRYYITHPLSAKMVVSNEPGYYEDGSFGVRTENLMIIKEVPTPFRFGGLPSLGFERLTLVPIQTKMIDASIMSPDEIAWLDQYHRDVWQAVSPRLQDKPELLEWLRLNTRPLAEQQK